MKSIFTRIQEEKLKYKKVGQKIGCIIIGLDEYEQIANGLTLKSMNNIIKQINISKKYTYEINGVKICVCDDWGSCFDSYPENNLKDL